MRIEITEPAVVDCITHPRGTVLEVIDSLGRALIARGKAKEYETPKKRARAEKASPENRMITDEDTRDV